MLLPFLLEARFDLFLGFRTLDDDERLGRRCVEENFRGLLRSDGVIPATWNFDERLLHVQASEGVEDPGECVAAAHFVERPAEPEADDDALVERKTWAAGEGEDFATFTDEELLLREARETSGETPIEEAREAAHRTLVLVDAARDDFGARLVEAPQVGRNEADVDDQQCSSFFSSSRPTSFAPPNRAPPLPDGRRPLPGNDGWGNAYYLRNQNRRPGYLKAWWNVVDWDAVAARFAG